MTSSCANCSASAASQRCTACIDAPLSETNIVYCNKDCQRAHWPEHKKKCRPLPSRKAVYRAGDFLGKLWMIFREATFDDRVVGIEERQGVLRIREDSRRRSSRLDGHLYPLDSRIFTNEKDRKSVLCFLQCGDSMAFLNSTVEWLLSDICVLAGGNDDEEVTMKLKNVPRPWKVVNENNRVDTDLETVTSHENFRLATKAGEAYALDISGAQYGWYDTILPWAEYMRERCARVVWAQAFGATSIRSRNIAHGMPDQSLGILQIATLNAGFRVVDKMDQARKDYFSQKSLSGPAFLKLSETAFGAEQEAFLRHIKPLIQRAAGEVDAIWPTVVREVWARSNQRTIFI